MTITNEVEGAQTPAGEVIKRDVLGRMWMSRQRREALLDEFEGSELNQAAFARQAGVKAGTFGSWVQERRQAKRHGSAKSSPQASTQSSLNPSSTKSSIRWVEAVVDHPRGGGLVGYLPGGARMEIADGDGVTLAVEVLRQLQGAQRTQRVGGC